MGYKPPREMRMDEKYPRTKEGQRLLDDERSVLGPLNDSARAERIREIEDAQLAQVAALREALERIAEHAARHDSDDVGSGHMADYALQVALRALDNTAAAAEEARQRIMAAHFLTDEGKALLTVIRTTAVSEWLASPEAERRLEAEIKAIENDPYEERIVSLHVPDILEALRKQQP